MSHVVTDWNVALPFHMDAGHGWLQVGLGSIEAVGLSPRDFSRYSYVSRSGDLFYLEEDCDMAKFCRAYELKFGKAPQFHDTYHDGECFIRSLPRLFSQCQYYTDAEYAAHNRAFCS